MHLPVNVSISLTNTNLAQLAFSNRKLNAFTRGCVRRYVNQRKCPFVCLPVDASVRFKSKNLAKPATSRRKHNAFTTGCVCRHVSVHRFPRGSIYFFHNQWTCLSVGKLSISRRKLNALIKESVRPYVYKMMRPFVQ